MGSKVVSGKNCEKQSGSHRCKKKNCRVRTKCESGNLRRTPPSHRKSSKEYTYYHSRYYF